jgi:RNase P subunit RPR2
MYIARVGVIAEEMKASKGMIDESLVAGLRKHFIEESKNVNAAVEFMSLYNPSADSVEHVLEIYLHGDTLFVDPEDYFSELISRVQQKSGKKIIISTSLTTEIPEEQTFICPRCDGMGWYYSVNGQNNKIVIDCEVCDTKQRVPMEVAKEATPAIYPEKFFCQGLCKIKEIETLVAEGVRACDSCLEQEQKTKEIFEQVTKTEVRTPEWTGKTLDQMRNQMSNHMRLLNESRSSKQ